MNDNNNTQILKIILIKYSFVFYDDIVMNLDITIILCNNYIILFLNKFILLKKTNYNQVLFLNINYVTGTYFYFFKHHTVTIFILFIVYFNIFIVLLCFNYFRIKVYRTATSGSNSKKLKNISF